MCIYIYIDIYIYIYITYVYIYIYICVIYIYTYVSELGVGGHERGRTQTSAIRSRPARVMMRSRNVARSAPCPDTPQSLFTLSLGIQSVDKTPCRMTEVTLHMGLYPQILGSGLHIFPVPPPLRQRFSGGLVFKAHRLPYHSD
jgi:hypothetical protein